MHDLQIYNEQGKKLEHHSTTQNTFQF
jgi:hypothetical protein